MQRENAEKLGIHRVSLARVEASAKVDKFRPMTFEKVFEDIERKSSESSELTGFLGQEAIGRGKAMGVRNRQ